MRYRSEGILAEVLPPKARTEPSDVGSRMAGDTLQDVDETVVGIGIVKTACGDQRTSVS